jgi:hypothetical protein
MHTYDTRRRDVGNKKSKAFVSKESGHDVKRRKKYEYVLPNSDACTRDHEIFVNVTELRVSAII